jgi:hypothetical protein
MVVRTIAELRSDMPVNVPGGITASDMQNFIDSVEEFTTQRISAKTASYTAVLADNRTFFTVSNASATTFTLPNSLPAGWECAIKQIGAGQVTVAVGSGGNLRHADNHTKTSKQWAVVYCKCYLNTGGTAAQISFTGDTVA